MPSSDSGSRSGLVLELAEEFLDRYRAGERPPLKEYVERHPGLADEIREVFPAMAMMEKIALADETLEARTNGKAPIPQFDQLGDYRVLREVGRGGMGVVYEAEQVSLGRHVALKVLPPQSLKDAKQRRRFEREAKAAAKLHHTNIVPVFGVGEQEETPYYVMQFIQGQGLDAVLDELKRLRTAPRSSPARAAAPIESTVPYEKNGRDVSAADVAQSLLTGRFGLNGDGSHFPEDPPTATTPTGSGSDVLSSSSLTLPSGVSRGKSRRATYWEGVARIGQQVAEALAYAHGQGIIHRDVKPSNLLLDTRGTVWVADFGLAKASDQQDLTHTGDILGTLRYMPPEAFGGKADSRGDIYSLGLTLYELLAFRPAFDERDRGRLVKQVTNDEPPPLKKLNPDVPRDLETIVQKAIERDPNHRYQSAGELADDLRRFVDDEPIQARRASVAERVARWGRRNPAVASLLGAVAVLLLAIITGLWQADRQARRALATQTALRQEADRTAELERKAKAEALAEKQRAESANRSLLATQDSLRSTLYAAQMNLTKVAWDSGNATRTLDLLADVVPKTGEPDPRGFEWHYWRRQVHGERTIRKLPGTGIAIFFQDAFSPDGSLAARSYIAPGQGGAGKIFVYETATGRLVHEFPLNMKAKNGESQAYAKLAFSADNKVLAIHVGYPLSPVNDNSASDQKDWEVRIICWKLSDQSVLFQESSVIFASVVALSVSLNGDGSRLCEATSLLPSFATRLKGAVQENGSVRVLDTRDGRVRYQFSSTDGYISDTEFSPDGQLVSFSQHKATSRAIEFRTQWRICEVETGRVRFDTGDQDGFSWRSGHFSPDGRRYVIISKSDSRETLLTIHDVETDRELSRETLSASVAIGSNLNFSSDGRTLIVASGNGPATELRDGETGKLYRSLRLGFDGSKNTVLRQSDGRFLTLSDDNLREWDLPSARPTTLDTGLVVKEIGRRTLGSVDRPLALAQGGRQLLIQHDPEDLSKPSELAIHDVSTGELLKRFTTAEPGAETDRDSQPFWIQPNRTGTMIVSVIGNKLIRDRTASRVRIWDMIRGREVLTLDRDQLGGVPSISFGISPQVWDGAGTRIALGVRKVDLGTDGKPILRNDWSVVIVEIPSGRILKRIPTGSLFPVASFRPDGKLLAIATTPGAAQGQVTNVDLIDLDSGSVVHQLSGDLSTQGWLIFSPDGLRLVASSPLLFRERGRVLIWDLRPGAQAAPVKIDDDSNFTYLLQFSPDGRRLASAKYVSEVIGGGEVQLWDTTTGRGLATWSLEKGVPRDLAFDPTGRQLRVASLEEGNNAGVTLLDASPLAPEIVAADLVASLARQFPLNAELIAKIDTEPNLDPEVRASARSMASMRLENPASLRTKAAGWLDLPAAERAPELMRRALQHADRAVSLMNRPTSLFYCSKAEARYRNGQFTEALEATREAREKWGETTPNEGQLRFRIEAVLALVEAKLGHATEAEAALANARKLWAEANPSATSPSPLLIEAEATLGQVKGA